MSGSIILKVLFKQNVRAVVNTIMNLRVAQKGGEFL
jgi:hypothetical protein